LTELDDTEIPRHGPGLITVRLSETEDETAEQLYSKHRKCGGVRIPFWEEIVRSPIPTRESDAAALSTVQKVWIATGSGACRLSGPARTP
jgi:hypothetical protein